MEKHEVGGACSTHLRDTKCILELTENPERKRRVGKEAYIGG
jgi:hypothetical protein